MAINSRRLCIAITCLILSAGVMEPAHATNPIVGKACKPFGKTFSNRDVNLRCIKSGNKLVWKAMSQNPKGFMNGTGPTGTPGTGPTSATSNEPAWFHSNWDVQTTAALKPDCAVGPILSNSPVAANLVDSIAPLGMSDGDSHVIPTSHQVWSPAREADGTQLDGAPLRSKRVSLVFPSSGHIVGATESTWTITATGQVYREQAYSLHVCGHKYLRFSHLDALPDDIITAIRSAPAKNCAPGQAPTGLTTISCYYSGLWIPVTAGSPAGVNSGRAGGFDVGAIDTSSPIGWISLPRYSPENIFGVCALEWFSSDTKSALYNKVARLRAGSDPCGRIDWDVANTASGAWFLDPTSSGGPLDFRAIALTDYYADGGKIAFTVGRDVSIAGFKTGTYYYAEKSTGPNNLPFKNVTNEKVVCYDGLQSGNQGTASGQSLLIQVAGGTLLVAALPTTCPATPAMPTEHTIFYR